ncbi:MAG: gluconolactonase [Flavobacteriaceae bacterium]|nr:MAG: gluconolactonase [Flavobacteriaceae bacterium]
MNKLHLIFTVSCIFLFMRCNTTSLHSTDFSPENSFTNGIEGPATDPQGNVYAVNYGTQGTIGKVSPDGHMELFLTLPNNSIGNGIRFKNNHQFYVADYVNHTIFEIDIQTKQIQVFAQDSSVNQPNDIAIAPNKTLYASDPNWSDNTGKLWKVTSEKGFELLEDNMGTTNGIEVSNNGKKLYVNESIQRNIWVYDILENGKLSHKTLFYKFEDFGLDGMRFHKNGNLYVCRYDKGTVAVLSPEGKLLEELQLTGKKVSNITFNFDYSRCYLTMADRGCLEMILL